MADPGGCAAHGAGVAGLCLGGLRTISFSCPSRWPRGSAPRQGGLAQAKADKPVVLLDHYENCGAQRAHHGAPPRYPGRKSSARAWTDVAFFGICDPAAVAPTARRPASGATVTVLFGGKLPMPALPDSRAPIEGHRHRGAFISAGQFVTEGRPLAGPSGSLRGPTVVLEIGAPDRRRQIEPVSP